MGLDSFEFQQNVSDIQIRFGYKNFFFLIFPSSELKPFQIKLTICIRLKLKEDFMQIMEFVNGFD